MFTACGIMHHHQLQAGSLEEEFLCIQATGRQLVLVHYTTSCKHSLVLLKMDETISRNMLS